MVVPEWFVAGVSPDVCGQVCRLAEPLVAGITLVRLLPRVGPHVRLQGARSGIRLPAQVAQVQLHVRIRTFKR